MSNWIFNTDESEVPGRGAYRLMIENSCIATWGQRRGTNLIAAPEAGDLVFYYRDKVGVIAMAEFDESAPFRSNDIFQKESEEEFSRTVVNLETPILGPITAKEVKAATGYSLPAKGRTPHRLKNEEAVEFLLTKFSKRSTPRGSNAATLFVPGKQYTRKEVLRALGLPDQEGGDWFTGYTRYEGDFYIFCGVGAPGRTGHDYQNRFEGDELIWFGRTGSKLSNPQIQQLLAPDTKVFIYFREHEREPFTFAGMGRAVAVEDQTPVKIRWTLTGQASRSMVTLPEEIPVNGTVAEGAGKQILVNIYERNPAARRRCIDHWGHRCSVCDFDFQKVYGDLGEGYIHVHHLKPLGEIKQSYLLDPVHDLRPVCPNCHAMIHRSSPALSIEDLRKRLVK